MQSQRSTVYFILRLSAAETLTPYIYTNPITLPNQNNIPEYCNPSFPNAWMGAGFVVFRPRDAQTFFAFPFGICISSLGVLPPVHQVAVPTQNICFFPVSAASSSLSSLTVDRRRINTPTRCWSTSQSLNYWHSSATMTHALIRRCSLSFLSMSLTEKSSSFHAQEPHTTNSNPTSPTTEENYDSYSRGGTPGPGGAHGDAMSRADSTSEDEGSYDELQDDYKEDMLSSSTPELPTSRPRQGQAFSESFQRYTSLPDISASSSSSLSSHREKIASSSSLTSRAPGGTATRHNTLPSLRSLPIYPSHYNQSSSRAQSSLRVPSPTEYLPHHDTPRAHFMPPSQARSPSPERPRRNSVMRLENILNSTSVDIGSQIPRSHSADHTRETNSQSTLEHDRLRRDPNTTFLRDTSGKRPDFRVISGWSQGNNVINISGGMQDHDDGDSESAASAEGLSTMDVDRYTPPPLSASVTGSSTVPSSSSTPYQEEAGLKASSSKSAPAPTVKKRKVKMHPCPECHKEFPRPSGLKTHMTIHTKEKPFACAYPGCSRTFSVVSNAKRHMRSHGIGTSDLSAVNSSSHDPNSPFSHNKKGKERAFMVDFDEPVVLDTLANFPPESAALRGEVKLKWPAKGMEMGGDGTLHGGADSSGHGTGAMVGSHRGSGKRSAPSGAQLRAGSQNGNVPGGRVLRGNAGEESGTR
ncbi:hypothetical protein CVT24_006477 [Panaeolus cyanescens]|uniref:C2H2-type domain-containing protein n=1 Tax=Panaeolus cyanescens TaxID=181874 RepID=A0A409VZ43_9AGAR|nr:hypothetical protein CVT24_006477 [Panaeolus cyanescens]